MQSLFRLYVELARFAAESEIEICEMGHADDTVTVNVYNHISSFERVQKELERIEKIALNLENNSPKSVKKKWGQKWSQNEAGKLAGL